MEQNFDGEIVTNLMEFDNIFSIKIFHSMYIYNVCNYNQNGNLYICM